MVQDFPSDASAGDGATPPLLSVVVPAFNEATTIRQVIAAIQAVDIDKEVIVVDDCSTDGTREILADMVAAGLPLHIVPVVEPRQGRGS